MSTNPFRRSSLKGLSDSGGGLEDIPYVPSTAIDIPSKEVDLSSITNHAKVPNAHQKHVNFASPPAIPISPVSYPPSPESTRISPELNFAQPDVLSSGGYGSALLKTTLHNEAANEENDDAIEQALQNARVNPTITAQGLDTFKEDAVRNTLSRFASTAKRQNTSSGGKANIQSTHSQRQTMDVDAFKRLLLTGNSGVSPRDSNVTTEDKSSVAASITDSASNTDSASLSQRSLFDLGSMRDDSSGISEDANLTDHNSTYTSAVPNTRVEGRKKAPPPTPIPRHGKLIKDDTTSELQNDQAQPLQALPLSTPHKIAPAPPLARKHSQNSKDLRPISSRQSSTSDIDLPQPVSEASTTSGHKQPPPPPKSRRPISMIDRRSSSDLPTTVEESDSTDTPTETGRKLSDSRPAPPVSRNSSKRVSMAVSNAPPLPPPPRRGRGSSRSSMDSQRPALTTVLGNSNHEKPTRDSAPVTGEGEKHATISNANDILADLAALQREVDEARQVAWR